MTVDLLLSKALRKALQWIFHFDSWHISPVQERPYAIDVIRFCNQYPQRKYFVEIGCGLGDITRAADFSRKTGFDMDAKVLKAAAWLNGKNRKETRFLVFQFPESQLPSNIDVLVMVNWIHHIEPTLLRQKLSEYLHGNIQDGGAIIIDTVQEPAYRFNHNVGFLTQGLPCAVIKIGEYARQREIWAIKKQL